MPMAPLRYCSQPGCSTRVTKGRCAAHRQQHERYRGSRIARGYDAQWLKLRAWFIRQPENVLCCLCREQGKTRLTEEVDHIKPFHGLHDPLRLAVSNLQGLCGACHRRKHGHSSPQGGGSEDRDPHAA